MAKDYDSDDLERDANRNRSSDNPQVAALSDLGDYEVAEGYPDPRGWVVTAADGSKVGKVHDLIVDTGSMRARYLDVRLADDLRRSADERDVLIPIGTATVDDADDRVRVESLTVDRFALLPAYRHGALTRDAERELRSHFTTGDAMSAGTIGSGAVAGADFYDHEHFDDRRFFSGRRDHRKVDDVAAPERGADRTVDRDIRRGIDDRDADRLTVSEEQLAVGKRQVSAGEVGIRKNVETRHVEQEVPLTREEVTVERRPLSADSPMGDVRISDDEIRVPVMREEAVIETRMVPVEEIIIRKTAVRDTKTVGADLRRERVEVDDSSVRGRDVRTDRIDDTRAR
jgi:uncharacterized protein (TIGR02271 family)